MAQEPIATRTAQTTWEGSLAGGTGTIATGSTALDGQTVTWAARTGPPEAKTSPEELCAAAHSSCFSMALALKLGENKTPPERLEVSSAVTLADVDGTPTITTAAIDVQATVRGLGQSDFDTIVADAAALCPVSRLFAGAEITVAARLITS